ncbi:MAG: c-type cytochrome, partial [Segetibacter sp.]
QFHNQMIHCDPGPNVVRSYPVKKNGAGYSAEVVNILKGEKDKWFRPADICVAPDGSLILADWYDVGVGGHQAGDQTRGRIYRIAPPNTKYTIPAHNYTTPAGAIAALQNPNLAVRYKAWTALQSMGQSAVPELENLWKTSANPRMRARAFWVLIKMPGANAQQYITQAMQQSNPDFRIMAIRAARELNADVIGVVRQLVNDADAQVRRECAIALHHNKAAEAAELWSTLAYKHDGKDRWYLEALGIGADAQWNTFFPAYLSKVKDPMQNEASRDIVWRSRASVAAPYIARMANDQQVALNNRLRYFRAFDYNEGPTSSRLLLQMIENNESGDTSLNKLVLHHLDVKTVKGSMLAQNALNDLLKSVAGTPEYIDLVRRYELKSETKNLLELAINKGNQSIGRNAAGLLIKLGGTPLVWKVINGKDSARSNALITSLSRAGSKESIDILQAITLSKKYPLELRRQAASKIGKSGDGEKRVLELLKSKKVPEQLIPDVVASVQGAWQKAVRNEALSYLPNATIRAAKKVPTMPELLALKVNAANGKAVFMNNCAVCHQVNKEGFDFGPNLSEIGSKYPKDGLLKQIVYPSAGISFNS